MTEMAEVSEEIHSALEKMESNSGHEHPETPPPSPINEHQTEAKIEYTEAATLRLPSGRGGSKRRSTSDPDNHGSSDHNVVPPVEFKDPGGGGSEPVITKAPSRQHSGQDDIELEVVSNGENGTDYQIDEERSTGESDAASAGTVSAKSTQRLISKKVDDDEDTVGYNCLIGCCTCLGIFCFT